MIPDLDIYRVAHLLVKRHGEDAPTGGRKPLRCPPGRRRPLFEEDAMINRRRLLSILFSLAGLAVLLPACKHGPPPGSKKKPESDSSGGAGGGSGGY